MSSTSRIDSHPHQDLCALGRERKQDRIVADIFIERKKYSSISAGMHRPWQNEGKQEMSNPPYASPTPPPSRSHLRPRNRVGVDFGAPQRAAEAQARTPEAIGPSIPPVAERVYVIPAFLLEAQGAAVGLPGSSG